MLKILQNIIYTHHYFEQLLDYVIESANKEPLQQQTNSLRARASALQMALVVKNLPASEGDARDTGLIPELGRFPGGGHGSPLQYSCLGKPTDRGDLASYRPWVTESQTQLST